MEYEVINRSKLERVIYDSMRENSHKDRKAGIHHQAEHLHILYLISQLSKETKKIGHWEMAPNQIIPCKTFLCSECRNEVDVRHYTNECYYDYCPHCGSMNGHRKIEPYKEIDLQCYHEKLFEKVYETEEEIFARLGLEEQIESVTREYLKKLEEATERIKNDNVVNALKSFYNGKTPIFNPENPFETSIWTDKGLRNLTDEESEIYEKWLEAESIDTGFNLFEDKEED